MFRKLLLPLLALLFTLSLAEGSVLELNPQNFKNIVEDPKKNVFVMFYAPWCGHCHHMMPVWEKLGAEYPLGASTIIARLDASTYSDIASKYGVKGFPTIRLFSKKNKGGSLEFNGNRELADFKVMTDLKLTERPGFKGDLNNRIIERINVLSQALEQPDLIRKFPHIQDLTSSWRKTRNSLEPALLAAYIDHTVLKANATKSEIQKLCEEAIAHHFKAVCVNGFYVSLVSELVKGTDVGVACVVGFPLGQMTTAMKAAEAADAVKHGANEIDMVLNVGALKDNKFNAVYEDIKAVKQSCGTEVTLKVIFETCLLHEVEIIDAAILSVAAGAEFVKTSTGFSTGGATPEAIDIMLAVVGNAARVKASGGVRDLHTASQYVAAGVDRIGTSSGVLIVSGGGGSTGY